MLSGLLEKKDCSSCQLCCKFDSYDIWEVPILNEFEKDFILQHSPDAEFIKWGNIWRFKIKAIGGGELWECPALSENGCIFGENKPFECAVWPFRVMETGGEEFLCVADFCEPINNKSLKEIKQFIQNGIADKIFNYAEFYPDIIKPYDSHYIPIIKKSN